MPPPYPNAPLVHTIFQARFPGETAVDLARPLIQRDLRSFLPKLYVPQAVPQIAPALQAYVFRSEDEVQSVEIAINSFSYTTRTYLGYEQFKAQALRCAQIFIDHVPDVRKLNRVGLRYVNHIPFLRESKLAAIPLKDYVNVGVNLPAGIPEANLTDLNSGFSFRLNGGQLKVIVQVEEGASPAEKERLVLDFDFAQTDNLDIEHLAEYLDIAHAHTKRVFIDLISERYLRFIKGEIE